MCLPKPWFTISLRFENVEQSIDETRWIPNKIRVIAAEGWFWPTYRKRKCLNPIDRCLEARTLLAAVCYLLHLCTEQVKGTGNSCDTHDFLDTYSLLWINTRIQGVPLISAKERFYVQTFREKGIKFVRWGLRFWENRVWRFILRIWLNPDMTEKNNW